MGYLSDEGFECLSMNRVDLILLTRRRDWQYHVDVVGRNGDARMVFRWCLAYLGLPHPWRPAQPDAQWYNRFDTNVLRMHDRCWTYLWSPWQDGDIDNFHLILWSPAIDEFETKWRDHFFGRNSLPSNLSIKSSGV